MQKNKESEKPMWSAYVNGSLEPEDYSAYTDGHLRGLIEDYDIDYEKAPSTYTRQELIDLIRENTDDDGGPEYEISVCDAQGLKTAKGSWGWGSEHKIILFNSDGTNSFNPGCKEQYDFAMQAAQTLADALNQKGIKAPT
jgi:hypothetical protein